MGQVTAKADIVIAATPSQVLEALADYEITRPAILPEQYSKYEVRAGGQGAGTVVAWSLHVTEDRVRHVVADVVADGTSLTETDRDSTLVTTYEVKPHESGSKLDVTTTWEGAGGVGGFFEKMFAPVGMGQIHTEMLENLAARLTTT